jgi:hypothetical protein
MVAVVAANSQRDVHEGVEEREVLYYMLASELVLHSISKGASNRSV